MKPIIISLALLLFAVTLFSQTNLGDEKEISSWLGEWEGELNIEFFAVSEQLVPKEALPMRIRHFKTDTIGTYGWFMIYGEDEEIGTRPLYLREKDPLNGHYLIT